MAEVSSGGLTPAQVQSLIASIMPQPSAVVPATESTSGVAGTDPTKYSQEGHKHPRLTSTTYATIAAGSTVQVPFTYKTADGVLGFINKPGMVMTEIEGDTAATSQPAIFKVQSWVTDPVTNRYTGAVIKCWRSQTVPQNLTTLLVSGVYNLFNTSVVGTNFSVIAIARSDV